MSERLTHQQLVETGKRIVTASPTEIFDFDVEADGVPGYGSLLSIGAIAPHGQQFYAELKPTSDLFIPSNRKFCEAHNLQRERLLDEGREPAEVMEEFRDWTASIRQQDDKNKAVLAAFNASFDFPWIDLEMKKAGINPNLGVAGFCTKSLSMALVRNYDWSRSAQHALPPEYLPPGELTHNALEDAVHQQKLHFALVGGLACHGLIAHPAGEV